MDSIIKLNSIMSGPYDSSKNRIDFDISEGTYDLSKSYINIRGNLSVFEDTTTTGEGIHNIQIGVGTKSQYQFNPVALVKNCSLVSSKQGNLEDIREVRLLQNTLKTFTRSTSQQVSVQYNSSYNVMMASRTKHCLFRELYRIGNTMSRDIDSNMRIPVSDLFGLGAMNQFTIGSGEKLRLHLEIDKDLITFRENDNWGLVAKSSNDMVNFDFEDYTNNSGAAETVITLTSDLSFIDTKDIPVWNGQLVRLFDSVSLGDECVIQNIQWGVNGKIEITLAIETVTTIPNGATLTGLNMRIVECDLDETLLTMFDAEIVLHKKFKTMPQSKLAYRTFTTEQFNGNGQTDFRRMFQVEPNCVNLMLMFPFPLLKIYSFAGNNILSYRIALNNVYLTDRRILLSQKQNDPLYYDELNRLFLNSSLQLNCLSQIEPFFNGDNNGFLSKEISYYGQNAGTYSGVNNNPFKQLLIGTPLPMTASEKNVELDIQGQNLGLNEMILYKQVEREVLA